MTFLKAHWLDVIATVCVVFGSINTIGGLVTRDTVEMSMGAVAVFLGAMVLERKL